MESYVVEIELLSEAIFGNGESGNIDVDIEILKDEYGIPYLKGKNFKGRLRKEAEAISSLLKCDTNTVKKLFGGEINEFSINTAKLRFSDCKLNKNILDSLVNLIKVNKNKTGYQNISEDDIIDSFTDIRFFTKINENGVAEKGSLRSARVIRKKIKLYCNINVIGTLTLEEKFILASSVAALRNIGTLVSRGKGNIKCKLLQKGKESQELRDVTVEYIEKFEGKCQGV